MADGLHWLGAGTGGDGLGELPTPLPVRPRNADLDQLMVTQGALQFGLHALGEPLFAQRHHRV